MKQFLSTLSFRAKGVSKGLLGAVRKTFALEDILYFGGLILIVKGVSMIYLPAGYIIGGLGLCAVGLGWLMRRPKEEEGEEKE